MAKNYRANGSAAYDIYQDTAARPLLQPKRLPDAPVRFPPEKKTKAKLSVAPLTVLGVVAVVVLCFVLIHSYASLYEAESRAAELQQENAALLALQEDQRWRYERSVDLDEVAERAAALGMHLPEAGQIVYVNSGRTEQLHSFERFYEEFLGELGTYLP
ncbi:MAG: hypothetical protein IJ453_02735 [Oscillospiraceae bacterium]|nr:hypothetical protein [Oscillospiraceae bacterium]